MGMIGHLKAITTEELARFLECSTEDEIATFLYVNGELDTTGDYLNIDKTWHGINFLLTGEPFGEPPLSWVIFGNHSVGGEDNQLLFGISHIGLRYLVPDEVVEVANALSSISNEDLANRFSPEAMEAAEIYPQGIWEVQREVALNYLLYYYPEVVKFYQNAASQKKAVLLYVT